MTHAHSKSEHPTTTIDSATLRAREVVGHVKGRVADFAAMHSLPNPKNMNTLDRSLLAERIWQRRHALRGGTVGFSTMMDMHGPHDSRIADDRSNNR